MDGKCLDRAVSFRLLVVGVKWPPETFLARLVAGLAEAGVQVTIATERRSHISWPNQSNVNWLYTSNWLHQILSVSGSVVKRTGGSDIRKLQGAKRRKTLFRRPRGLFDRIWRWYCSRPFASQDWDIIYFPWNSAAIAYPALFELGCPVVVSCRGSQVNVAPHNPKRELIRDGLRETFQRAAAVHCVSESIKLEAMQYGLDPTKAWVIRPAVDPQFFYPPSSTLRQDGCFHIVSTGSLIWRKGYEYALLAIRRLVDMGVPAEFEIIGEGPERQRILYTIDDLGLCGYVHLLGQLSPEQVRERLQQADTFLLSSLSEGISNAVLEAMSCGLPVVTTDCGGMTEVVTNGVEGFVVPVRDPDTMANRLQALWENPELRSAMGAAARERVVREFSLERQIREFLFMYQSVISKWNAQCQTASC